MMNFCTLFDSNYISKGIALYLSLESQTKDFNLYVMAMDRECQNILEKLDFPHIKVECIEDNMSSALEIARGNRSKAEFNWTCGSYVTHRFITKYNLPDITYLDSDLMFFASPQIIYDELKKKNASVGLSPHFVPYNASGKYCVQYCYFKNDKDGMSALSWWREQCLNWCYSKIEDGKYGDQMYLEQMPTRFNHVSDIENRGAGMAYWNEFAYKFSAEGLIFKGKKYPFIFFHYSGFNIALLTDVLTIRECYPIKQNTRTHLIFPYIELIRKVYEKYLGKTVKDVRYVKDYSTGKKVIGSLSRSLMKFKSFHRMKAYMLTQKYKKRKSPYSEK